MASISTDKAGNRKIQFSDGNGNRKIIRLGKRPMKDAELILSKIESLVEAKLSCRSLAPEVAVWVGKIPAVLAMTFPAHVVCGWMGNSEAVAGEHYLHTTDADFQKATHNQTHSTAEMSEMAGTVRPAGNPQMRKASHFRGFPLDALDSPNNQLPDQDSNRLSEW